MIRRLRKDDIDQVVELENKYLGTSLGHKILKEELDRQVITMLVDEIDNEVIGFICGYFLDGIGEIYNFVVDEKYQRQGIGTELLNEIILINNAYDINLEVRANNTKAINFYKKNGFEQISIRKNYYSNGEDGLVLKKVIK